MLPKYRQTFKKILYVIGGFALMFAWMGVFMSIIKFFID
jgi:hypothetical protein